ncbi:MAG: hypothetical protein FWG68_09000 [Defluviitaleaceae bacterium]|nr:hypothetical protein [Defluviitaleaceae bacterium]
MRIRLVISLLNDFLQPHINTYQSGLWQAKLIVPDKLEVSQVPEHTMLKLSLSLKRVGVGQVALKLTLVLFLEIKQLCATGQTILACSPFRLNRGIISKFTIYLVLSSVVKRNRFWRQKSNP